MLNILPKYMDYNCHLCGIKMDNDDDPKCEKCYFCDELCSNCKKPYIWGDLVECIKCNDHFCNVCSFDKPGCNPYFNDGWRMPDKYTCTKCSSLYFFASIQGYDENGRIVLQSGTFVTLSNPSQYEIIKMVQNNHDDVINNCKLISFSELSRKQYEAFVTKLTI